MRVQWHVFKSHLVQLIFSTAVPSVGVDHLLVFLACLHDVFHAIQGRRDGAVAVMKSVRFPSMSRDYLLHITETEDIIKNNSECLQMVSSIYNLSYI